MSSPDLRVARIWDRALRLPIADQDQADAEQRRRPEPAERAALAPGQPQFEPARGAGEHAEDRDWQVRQLDQELVFDPDTRVRVEHQHRATEQ